MKKYRILSLTVLAAMALTALAGCGGNTSPQDTAEAVTEEVNILDTLNFGNVDFNISMSASNLSTHQYMMGPEEAEGDVVDIAVFNRNLAVEERLGVNFVYETTDYLWNEVASNVRQLIMSGDDTFDLIVDDQIGLGTCAAEGLFVNAHDCKYFDFSKDGWWYDYMKDACVDVDELYLLVGDYFINVLERAFVIYTNMDIFTEVSGETKEDLYNTVLDREWTYDKMNEYVSMAYDDVNGDTIANQGDRFGFMVSNKSGSMISFVYSSDVPFITRDEEGYPTLTMNGERAHQLYDKISTLINNSATTFSAVSMDTSGQTTRFMNGEALFVGDSCIADFAKLRDMKYDLGLLPYPMVDETQKEYNTTVWDVSEVGGIPVTAKDPDMSSAVVQALCEISVETVTPAYYETQLKLKYTRDDITAQILDVIYNNIRGSFPLIYNNNHANRIFLNTFVTPLQSGADGIASTYASLEPAAIAALDELVETYQNR